MKHPNSSNNQANVTSRDRRDAATTRELPVEAPKAPIMTLALMGVQIVVLILGIILFRNTALTGVILLGLGMILFLVTLRGWSWWPKYYGSRIVSKKKLDNITPGTWVARPGSRHAVVIKQEPTGAWQNPTIADGLTQQELEIIAPVYVFQETPKDSKVS